MLSKILFKVKIKVGIGCVKFLAKVISRSDTCRGEVSSPSLEHILSVSSGGMGMWQGDYPRARRPRPYVQCQELYTPVEIWSEFQLTGI